MLLPPECISVVLLWRQHEIDLGSCEYTAPPWRRSSIKLEHFDFKFCFHASRQCDLRIDTRHFSLSLTPRLTWASRPPRWLSGVSSWRPASAWCLSLLGWRHPGCEKKIAKLHIKTNAVPWWPSGLFIAAALRFTSLTRPLENNTFTFLEWQIHHVWLEKHLLVNRQNNRRSDVNTYPANGILSFWVGWHVRKHTTKHTRMTKCNFIILSLFSCWHARLILQSGQQQVPAQTLWPNQSCNKVLALPFFWSFIFIRC